MMTTLKEILIQVEEHERMGMGIFDKWYEIGELVGEHIAESTFTQQKLAPLNEYSLNGLCIDFMTDCTEEMENLLGVKCIEGLTEYIDKDARNPLTGEFDSDRQFAIAASTDICAEKIGKIIHGDGDEDKWYEWIKKHQEEGEPAEGIYGELGAKIRYSTWRDKIM